MPTTILVPWEVRLVNDGKRPWGVFGQTLHNGGIPGLEVTADGPVEELARFRKQEDAKRVVDAVNGVHLARD